MKSHFTGTRAPGNSRTPRLERARCVSGWRQVTMAEASRLAEAGKVTISGQKEPGDNGHVLAMWPGTWKQAGGFLGPKGPMIPTKELYPPAMSGSSNRNWPGAHSRGEKTVFDA
jgi:hypothetical protein